MPRRSTSADRHNLLRGPDEPAIVWRVIEIVPADENADQGGEKASER